MDITKVKHIVVLGGGESGTAAARLARAKGFDVFVSDLGSFVEHYRKELTQDKIDFEEGKHSETKILTADLIIKSPGIPDNARVITKINEAGIPIISDIEFGSYFTRGRIIGITGSNGKTTTTLLTYHIFKNAGLDVACGGNIGTSICRFLLTKDYDYFILELSSFQLDYCFDFRCHTAILLNITPDHLDRYDFKMKNYVTSKFRILQNQSADDYFIFCADDPETTGYLKEHQPIARCIPFSASTVMDTGAYIKDGFLHFNISEQNKFKIDMNILTLVGTHNKYNSMAASVAASIENIRDDIVRECLSNFENIEHRLEHVANIHGVEFINDSKATNLNASWFALESMVKPVIWIVGGIDKGNNYEEIKPLVKDNVKAIVCLGVDNSKIIEAFQDDFDLIFDTSDIKEAVEIAYRLAEKDNVVLLSPACASFDLFKNYEDRGSQFKEAVRGL